MDKIKEKIDPQKINIIKNIAIVISIIIVLCLLFYYLTNYLELNNYNSIINKASNKEWNIVNDIKYIRHKQKENFENF